MGELSERSAMTSPHLTWLKVFGAIAKGSQSLEHATCPRCHAPELRAQFVASPTDLIGYAAMWCQNCLHGIWVSRAKVPDGWGYETFEDAEGGLIPSFIRIEPKENVC